MAKSLKELYKISLEKWIPIQKLAKKEIIDTIKISANCGFCNDTDYCSNYRINFNICGSRKVPSIMSIISHNVSGSPDTIKSVAIEYIDKMVEALQNEYKKL